MVVIDATMLMPFLRPDIPISVSVNGVRVERAKERIDYLVKQLEKERTKIIVPTPVLSEILVRAGAEASEKIIEFLQKYSVFRIEPFDTRAAIEVAAMTRELLNGRERKRGTSNATWTKIKFDRQIVAIAKVSNATIIYSDDDDVRQIATRVKIKVRGISDLELPPQDAQLGLELTGTHEGGPRSSGENHGQDQGPAEG